LGIENYIGSGLDNHPNAIIDAMEIKRTLKFSDFSVTSNLQDKVEMNSEKTRVTVNELDKQMQNFIRKT